MELVERNEKRNHPPRTSHEIPHTISVLDRFAYIGDTAMGALSFEPEHETLDDNKPSLDLFALAHANEQILAGQDTDILRELLIVGGSPQGARPKALVYYDKEKDFISTDNAKNPSLEPWLVKFPAQNEHKSVCLLESIYADHAKKAGLEMPEHRYFDIDGANGVGNENGKYGAFAVKRFDRVQNNGHSHRVHIHTLAGLLDIDFRTPSIDYTQYLRCVRMLTGSQKQVEQAYRHCVFNVVFNNKDDHSKNFSFILSERGWQLSPVYDVTYNTGMNGYHQMDVCGEALKPTRVDLLTLATTADIKKPVAITIIDEVMAVASDMLGVLDDYPLEEGLREAVVRDVGKV